MKGFKEFKALVNKTYTNIYLYSNIFQWFYQKLYAPIMVFFETLQRIKDYIPILWRDRDFDFVFAWPLLLKKFERMEKLMRRSEGVHASFRANEIKIAMILLDRLNNDSHYGLLVEKYKDKYPTLLPWQIEHELYNEDLTFLFELIAKHHKGWWD
jgi:hypothetical protein